VSLTSPGVMLRPVRPERFRSLAGIVPLVGRPRKVGEIFPFALPERGLSLSSTSSLPTFPAGGRPLWGRLVRAVTVLLGVPLLALLSLTMSGCSKKSSDTIKVGIMHSLTGTMAISETSLKDVELMAIDEINKAGGVLGKQIEPIVEDPASDFETGFPEKAKKLLLQDKVAAVFGCWTSASRKSVLKIFEDNNGLLFYPVQYEGNECSKNVIYTGAAPNQQILPAVDYLWKEMGKRKFYLLGSDYIFPRTANQIIIAHLKKKYMTDPVAEKYTPLGHKDYKSIVDDIRKRQPDVIFSTINGDSNINFYNELADAGITAKEIPVLAVSVAEDELRGLDKQKFQKFVGHLAAWNYFQSIDTPANKEFVKKFRAWTKDESRVTDDPIEASYFMVYMWKNAVEKAKSTDVDKVREAIKDLVVDAPSGKVKVDGKNFHTWRPILIGRINQDAQFDILYRSKEWVRPDPYPPVAYPYDCDWSRGGKINRK
jgi:urea transport system substrate-binding protein